MKVRHQPGIAHPVAQVVRVGIVTFELQHLA
jgi:hypothetical protein